MKKLLTFLVFVLFISLVTATDGEFGAGTFGDGEFGTGTITPAEEESSNGGGGDSSSSSGTFTATFRENRSRTFMMLKNKYSRFRLNSYEEQHTARVSAIIGSSVVLEINSVPTSYRLYLNKTEYIDVDKNGTRDLKVTLERIRDNYAYIEFEKVTEKVTVPITVPPVTIDEEEVIEPEVSEPVTTTPTPTVVPKKNYGWGIAITLVIIMVIVGLVFYFKKKKTEEEYVEDTSEDKPEE